MLVRPEKKGAYKRPRRGECGAVFTQARDGHWYCIRKRRSVDDAVCERCDEREWLGCGERE